MAEDADPTESAVAAHETGAVAAPETGANEDGDEFGFNFEDDGELDVGLNDLQAEVKKQLQTEIASTMAGFTLSLTNSAAVAASRIRLRK